MEKLPVPEEERGWVVVCRGRNLIQACRVNELQSHPCAQQVRINSPRQRERNPVFNGCWGRGKTKAAAGPGWVPAGMVASQQLCWPIARTRGWGTPIAEEVVIFHCHLMIHELIDIYSRCITNSGASSDNCTYFSVWGRKKTALNTMSYETDLQRAA